MKDTVGWTLWTYRADGGETEQVFNPGPCVVPDFITLLDGTPAALDRTSVQVKGEGWTPPQGMRQVRPWTPDPGADCSLGWPGMTQVS